MRRTLLICLALFSFSAAGASAARLVSTGAPAQGASTAALAADAKPIASINGTAVGIKASGARKSQSGLLFGTNQVGRSVQQKAGGSVEFFRYKNKATGMASALRIFIGGASHANRLMVGLYSDKAGHPGSRLGAGSMRAPKAGGWNNIAIGQTLVKPGSYWIAVLGEGGMLYLRGLGNCGNQAATSTTMRSLPRGWTGSMPSSACAVSAYVMGHLTTATGSGSGSGSTTSTTILEGPLAPVSTPTVSLPVTTPTTTTNAPLITLPPINSGAPTVSGTATEGNTLTTSNGSWLDSPTSYAYQWQRCTSSASCSNISGATSSTYKLVAADVGDTIRSVVTASNSAGSASANSSQTSAVAAVPPPANTALPTVSGTAQQGDVLTTTNGSWSGSPSSFAYQWQRCTSSSSCANISGATSTTYTLQAADVGDTVRSVVTATNAGGSTSANSAQTGTVAAPPSPPANTAAPTVSGTAQQGAVLTTTNGSWSGSPSSFAYQWQRCTSSSSCANISGATSTTYTLQAADVGDTVRSVVTATNAGGSTSANSAQTGTVAAASSAPVNTAVPTVSGTAQQGDVLTTSNGSWSGSPTSYAYQWQRCSSGCSNIGGATSSTYTLAAADVGDTVRSVVTATNSSGSASANSAQTGTVAASGGGGGGGGTGSGSGLHVSAQNEPCPNSTATTCADLLDANGNIVHMHGVDLSGTEYACIQGWGIFSGAQNTQADINSMLAWHINFVRIQLNEDCWLGVNTSGISSSYVDTSPGVGSYATAIENFVNLLHQNGIYTEIDDMWNAPGTDQAVGQSGSSSSFQGGAYYGPDEDHSPAMWASMASAFASDPDTILSPAGEENVSMACQMNGCANEGKAPNNVDGLGSCGTGCYYYNVAGLSQALSVMRSNGFKGPIALGCAHFEGTCDQGSGATWLADKPTDSLNPSQILAEVHNYGSGDCAAGASCFDSQFLPILQAGYPVFEGELGEGVNGGCTDTFLPQATSWADSYGVGYMDWTWTVGTGDCYALLTNYNNPNSVPSVASFTGTISNGSTQVTGVSSTSNLALGQIVTGSGLPAGDAIAAISGSTLTMSLESSSAGGVSLTALQGDAGWIQAHDESYTNAAPQTNISRGQPAYCMGSCSNSASVATDNDYGSSYASGHYFDCRYPCGVAIDLSGVPASERHNAIVAWYNGSVFDPGPNNGVDYYSVPSNYTIDVNTAAGGTLPQTGWTPVQTVTNNPVTSRVADVNLNGANWVRIYATTGNANNASGNTDFDFKLDVMSDNSSAPPDTWLFLGDSVTDNSMSHQDVNSSGSCCFGTDFMQSVNAAEPSYYPAQINGGIGSWPSEYELRTNSLTNETYFQDALNYSGVHYLAIDYGGTNSVSGDCTTFYSDETTMITDAFAAGYQPVSRYSPTWSQEFPTSAQNIAQNIGQYIHGPALPSGKSCPAESTYLYQIYPQLLVGPDYYNFFQTNQNLNYAAGSGNPHPTHPQGENAYRQLYVQAALYNAHGG